MKLDLSTIIEDCQANVFTRSNISFDSIKIHEIVFDTRKVKQVSDAMFLCLAKHENDILHHIKKAEEKGIKVFLIPNIVSLPNSDSIFLKVGDVISSIQQIATKHRSRILTKVIGITGSNGKTIIKEWLSQLLEIQFKVTKSPASFNSQLGVPLSVLLLDGNSDYGIFEAGISQKNEMSKLESIIQCQFGILTNIGDAHSLGFQNQQEKLEEKLKLFKNSEKLIFEESNVLSKPFIRNHSKAKLVSWSFENNQADYNVEVDRNNDFVLIHITGKHKLSVVFYLRDKASIKNAIHVIISGLELGLHANYIIDRIRYLEPVSMRLVMKKALRNCIIIDDSYNADLTSLENALDFAIEQKKTRQLHLVLTEFDQINQGKYYFEKLAEIISKHEIDKISYVGDHKPILIHSSKIQYYSNIQLLKEQLKNQAPENQAILLKGARRFQLDHLLNDLIVKSHRTELMINLNAISHNIKTFKTIIEPSTSIMAVIKAGAYGSDSISLAKHLLRCGVEYLAVAYYDEAIELRKEGISAPIMIMNPDPSLSYLAVKYDLELEIYSFNQLQKILSSTKQKLKIHLKIDSGMHRLGLQKDELNDVLKVLNNKNYIEVKSIFSHFSSAEDQTADNFTREQHNYFDKISSYLLNSNVASIDKKSVWRHICNSNASIRFPEFHHEMIRLGIGIYGYINNFNLIMAHSLKTYVAQVLDIKVGESVGYNRSFIASKPTRVATLCIGYADGLSRKVGNGKMSFTINDIPVKTVGNISMDTCSVNVSGMNVEAGDEVIIYNTIEQFNLLCELSERTAYEMISGIGSRVVRSYIKE